MTTKGGALIAGHLNQSKHLPVLVLPQVHFYDYQGDAFDPATYPPAKFVSEYGFMSLPSFAGELQLLSPL